MRIQSSAVSMMGATSRIHLRSVKESMKFWVGNSRVEAPASVKKAMAPALFMLSRELRLQDAKPVDAPQGEGYLEIQLDERDKQKLLLLQDMVKALTGKNLVFVVPVKIKLHSAGAQNAAELSMGNVGRAGWGLEYSKRETYYEAQQLTFSSSGSVTTEDGQDISFTVDLNVSQEFAESSNISFRAGDAAVDPLVINFSAGSATLTNEKFSFDIDVDGQNDKISFLAPGSGFLALDLNKDDVISNGAELFGPKSGNGFGELAEYDVDKNNWIDENDPVYKNLRIWTQNTDGSKRLLALGQVGVGAIYLGNITTKFELKPTASQTNGIIQRTGVFLRENGTAGTIQHVDFTI